MPGKEDSPLLKETMGPRGFLEEIYLGDFQRDFFEAFSPAGRNPEAEDIIRRYRELIRDDPPDSLEKEGKIPEPLWRSLKEIGLFGLNIPKRFGGAGLSLTGYLSVLQAMARTDMALALNPTAHLSIGIKGILLYGSDDQKKKYLPPAARGEMIFAYALTEPRTGSDARHIEATAVLAGEGGHYLLNGQKTYITNGNYAGGADRLCPDGREASGIHGGLHRGNFMEGS